MSEIINYSKEENISINYNPKKGIYLLNIKGKEEYQTLIDDRAMIDFFGSEGSNLIQKLDAYNESIINFMTSNKIPLEKLEEALCSVQRKENLEREEFMKSQNQ